jgi:hypothetical protein
MRSWLHAVAKACRGIRVAAHLAVEPRRFGLRFLARYVFGDAAVALEPRGTPIGDAAPNFTPNAKHLLRLKRAVK